MPVRLTGIRFTCKVKRHISWGKFFNMRNKRKIAIKKNFYGIHQFLTWQQNRIDCINGREECPLRITIWHQFRLPKFRNNYLFIHQSDLLISTWSNSESEIELIDMNIFKSSASKRHFALRVSGRGQGFIEELRKLL